MSGRLIALALSAMAAVAGILLLTPKKKERDQIDGGVRRLEDTNAPKVINSEDITSFFCRLSTMDICMEDSPVAGEVYTFKADAEGAWCKRRNRPDESDGKCFLPDKSFFVSLRQIVSEYDLARYNGIHYSVSGLPPDYGADLKIEYASGEYISATNNQNSFLPLGAAEKLVTLFKQYYENSGGK